MKDGVVVVDKPSGMTSHDVVAIARKKLGERKIGHTGTLDPMATGVLPLCVGNATRYADYIMEAPKKYRCTMRLGIETTTQDIWGEVIARSDADLPSATSVRSGLAAFVGVIMQIPPSYSAIKIAGDRLVDLARRGETPEVEARRRFVYSIDIISICKQDIEFDILCSKGTYIRTICHDLGRALGVGGTMTSLRRLSSGGFSIEQAAALDALDAGTIESSRAFVALDDVVMRIPGMGVIRIDKLNPKSRKMLDDGVKLDLAACRNARIDDGYDLFTVYMDGSLYGIASRLRERIQIIKRFS